MKPSPDNSRASSRSLALPFARPLMLALPLALPLALAACGGAADDDVTELDTATTDGEAAVLDGAIEPGDFADLALGARIVGPQGPEVESRMTNEAGAFADMRSFVACPDGIDPCDPASAPSDTVYTFVHVVFPGEDNEGDTGSGDGNDSSDIERALTFRMTQPAHGFTGAAGYSKGEVMAAVGAKAEVAITCDDGGLVWTINAGDGGNQWEQAEPITFYWQSTLPPAGPADAYAIDANYTQAMGAGPYPAADPDASKGCVTPG